MHHAGSELGRECEEGNGIEQNQVSNLITIGMIIGQSLWGWGAYAAEQFR